MSDNQSIKENYSEVLQNIPEGVTLVAVSKTHSVEQIKAVYDLGQKVFGENKVQEMVEKYHDLPKDILWRMIGHLQTNKIKYIAAFIDTIESVDSRKLLVEINKQAHIHNRTINVLLQVKIAQEETKYGLPVNETKEIFTEYNAGEFPNVRITGLMGMASFTENLSQVENEFTSLKQLFDELSAVKKLDILSMGMSNDYPLAITCGANSVRIGSAIFGYREYKK